MMGWKIIQETAVGEQVQKQVHTALWRYGERQ